jgi:hypothetical protein
MQPVTTADSLQAIREGYQAFHLRPAFYAQKIRPQNYRNTISKTEKAEGRVACSVSDGTHYWSSCVLPFISDNDIIVAGAVLSIGSLIWNCAA